MIKSLEKNLIVFNNNINDNNAYMLIERGHCIVIDPSSYGQTIENYINEHKLIFDGILLTHGHFDHIESANELMTKFKVNAYCHKSDEIVVNKYNCAEMMSNPNFKPLSDSYIYFNQKELKIKNFKLEVLFTPGHTAGSVCYHYQHYFFTGDTIFYDSVGRWDLPTGNQKQLFDSIKKFMNVVKHDDLILPGHCQHYETYNNVEKANLYIIHFKGAN